MQPDPGTSPLVHGYVRMEEPDEVKIAVTCKDLSTFCKVSGYRLGSVFVDRGVADEQFARTGFVDLLATVRLNSAHGVVVPTLDHLSSRAFIRDALKRVVEQLGARVLVAYRANGGTSPQLEHGTDLGPARDGLTGPGAAGRTGVRQPIDVPACSSTAGGTAKTSYLVPGDDSWQADKALMAELAKLNTQVTRYVLRHLAADAGRAEPITVEDEQALAERLTGLAAALQARAERRVALGSAPLCVEGETTSGQPVTTLHRRSPHERLHST
jgi:hypothetical protein